MTEGALNLQHRQQALEEMANGEELDILVLGGGVTGAGIAYDAALRGLTDPRDIRTATVAHLAPARAEAMADVLAGFAAYARAFGGVGFTVERTEDFPAALCDALAARRPAIIHVKMSVDAIAPSAFPQALPAPCAGWICT